MNLINKTIDFIMAIVLLPIFLIAMLLVFIASTILYLVNPEKFWLAYPYISDEVLDVASSWIDKLLLK